MTCLNEGLKKVTRYRFTWYDVLEKGTGEGVKERVTWYDCLNEGLKKVTRFLGLPGRTCLIEGPKKLSRCGFTLRTCLNEELEKVLSMGSPGMTCLNEVLEKVSMYRFTW